jgi:hypothetical protein
MEWEQEEAKACAIAQSRLEEALVNAIREEIEITDIPAAQIKEAIRTAAKKAAGEVV